MMLEMSPVAWNLDGLGSALDSPSDWEYFIDADTAGSVNAVNLGTAAGQPNITMPSFVSGPPDYWGVNTKLAALTTAFSQIGTGPCTWAYLMMPTDISGTVSRRYWSTGTRQGNGTTPGWSLYCLGPPARSTNVAGIIVEQTTAVGGLFRGSSEVPSPGNNQILCVVTRQYSGGNQFDVWCNGIRNNPSTFVAAGSRNASNASEIGGLFGVITNNLNHRLYRAAMSKSFVSDEDVFATIKSWLNYVGATL